MNNYERYWLRSNRATLAAALHEVFEDWVAHLPADDDDWLHYADQVTAAMMGDAERAG